MLHGCIGFPRAYERVFELHHYSLRIRSYGQVMTMKDQQEVVRKRKGWLTVLGPPGTGKTTRLIWQLEEEIAQGVGAGDIAFSTFTRAARTEAKERAAAKLGIDEDMLRWFRTIHGAAHHLVGAKHENKMVKKHWKEFANLFGYIFSDQADPTEEDEHHAIVAEETEDDKLRTVYEWGRARMLDPKQMPVASHEIIDTQAFVRYVERYAEYKSNHNLWDFSDLLEDSLGLDARPPVEVAFIDEAQDLSPLQVACVQHWFLDHVRTVYVAGDDDQAIYVFQGSDPAWLIKLVDESEAHVILDQSYRVPRKPHALASAIITQNRSRVPKEYKPKASDGTVRVQSMSAILLELDELDRAQYELEITVKRTVFLTCRNWWPLRYWCSELRLRGIAFKVDKFSSWSPLGRPALISAVEAGDRLRTKNSVSAGGFRSIIDRIPQKGNLPRGLKTWAKNNSATVTRKSLLEEWPDASMFLDRLDKVGSIQILVDEKPVVLRDLEALRQRYNGFPERTFITVSSIHQLKGREADMVIIDPSMTRRTWDAYDSGAEVESEHRVAYVAVTRTKDELVLAQGYHRSFPYVRYAKKCAVI